MKKKLIILAGIMAIMILVVFATAYYNNRNYKRVSNNEEKSISVVASFYPTYVLAINLTDGISDIEVDGLTDFSGGCLHDYQLTANDMRLLSNADVFIINGGGMEEYLANVIDSYPHLKIINLSEGITMLESQVHHGGDNPHVWLDPHLYMLQIENAREGLVNYIQERVNVNKDNTNNESDYNKEVIEQLNSNADAYLEEVAALADDMNIMLDRVEDLVQNKNISNKVVVFHDSFAYLSNKAGLEVAYTIEIDEDTPLSAGEVAEVVDVIRQENILYLFTEEQYDDTISDRIMDETEAQVYVIDSAVTGDGTKDSYLKAMRRNIETLKKAFVE
ncbi:MAG: zinc ABC transporter substrate-binding protein [Clostridiales bacterium]|jgi:zinc transport system substrate-binding protein|nr:zinc ABC transporter substrate-binding protein [Clostridiales bacterium]